MAKHGIYEYESLGLIEGKVNEIYSKFSRPGSDIYYSNGSFGDNYLHLAALSYRKRVGSGNFRFLVESRFEKLVKLYDLQEHSIFIDQHTSGTIRFYFVNSNSWLRNPNSVKPLLPVYYPLLPYLIDRYEILDHYALICATANVPVHTPSPPKISEINDPLFFNAKSQPGKILLIFPETNSVECPEDKFWIDLHSRLSVIDSLTIRFNCADSSTLRRHLPADNIINLRPDEVFPAIYSASFVISSASGVGHLSRIFTPTPTFVVCDYSHDPIVRSKCKRYSSPVERQFNAYNKYYKNTGKEIKFRSDNFTIALDELYLCISQGM